MGEGKRPELKLIDCEWKNHIDGIFHSTKEDEQYCREEMARYDEERRLLIEKYGWLPDWYGIGCEPRKSRKEHVCGRCGGVIRVGEMYEWKSAVDKNAPEGRKWEITRICLGCVGIYGMIKIKRGEMVDVSMNGDYTDMERLRKYKEKMKKEEEGMRKIEEQEYEVDDEEE